jgi:hypothetical protein
MSSKELKEAEKARKEQEKKEEKERKEAEKARKEQEKKERKEAEKARKEAEKARKEHEKKEQKERKEAEKVRKAEEKELSKIKKNKNNITIPFPSEYKRCKDELDDQRILLQAQYEVAERKATRKGKKLVYDNQKEAAIECWNEFEGGAYVVLLIAQPGTGKTGTILELLHLLTTTPDDDRCVAVQDIQIISGMNDKDWRDQFKEKMLDAFSNVITHRGALYGIADHLVEIRNGFIITDECHIASNEGMTVDRVIQHSGLKDLSVAQERNVRMIEISATPESVCWDLEHWGPLAKKVFIKPGPSYKGFQVMLDENRIRQAPELESETNAIELIKFFDERYSTTTKKYFPMRINNETCKGNIRVALSKFGWRELRHDSINRVEGLDKMMKQAPSHHTVIFIKGFWRASKRLEMEHIGGSYEKVPEESNDTSAAQGLIARHCDNYEYSGDQLNKDLRPVHFGDKDSIERYLKWFENGCDYQSSNYKSSRITSNDGKVTSEKSKLDPENFENLEGIEIVNEKHSDKNKRVPIVINVDKRIIEQLNKKQITNEEELQIILNELSNQITDSEFMNIVTNTNCFQISRPGKDTNRSYKIHIEDPVRASQTKKRLGLMDLKKDDRGTAGWQVFIDTTQNRLVVLWQVEDTKQKDNLREEREPRGGGGGGYDNEI